MLLSLVFSSGLRAQPPVFEVASVRLHVSTGKETGPGDIPRNVDPSPGHFAMRNVPFIYLLEWAYDLKDYEISGIRGDERYDVVATAPGRASNEQMKQMLQGLLAERFQLKLHWDTRSLPVYVLALGKGAPKLKQPSPDSDPDLSGGPAGVVHFRSQPISRLVYLLTHRMYTPVVDKTGLIGIYDFSLDLSGLKSFDPHAPDDTGSSIFAAVQRDLGLKLESRREPLKVVVVESVRKIPTEN
jgi:uncharacterized protein (TIGR03435 family)